VEKIVAQLLLEDHSSHHGKLLGVKDGYARVKLDRDSLHKLTGEKNAQLLLFGTGIGGEHKAIGSIVRATTRELLFSYDDPSAFRELLEQGAGKLFNRRRAYRITPSPQAPVQVTIQRPTGLLIVKTVNVSAQGLAILVDRKVANSFAGDTAVKLTIQLPETPTALGFVAKVQHVIDAGKHFLVGLMFDPGQTPRFAISQDALTSYVMGRQRDGLHAIQ
jgi:hypothetical protein